MRRQKLKHVGHVTGHNGLEKTTMQEIVAETRSRGKQRQNVRNIHHNMYVWYDGSSKHAEWPLCSDVLKMIML